MATNNAINSNIPIEIAKGGTNATSMTTTNGVVYYDGTQLATTAAGTSGQVLTSNGAGVAPTYQSITDGLVFLSSQTANNVAQIDFTSVITSTYTSYLVLFYDVDTTSALTSVLGMKISTDNGATFLGGTSYFSGNTYNPIRSNNTWAANSVSGGAQWNLNNGQVTGGGNPVEMAGTLYLTNFASTGRRPQVMGMLSGHDFNTNYNWYTFCAYYNGLVNVNAIRFFYASGGGNIATGTFTLYGIKET